MNNLKPLSITIEEAVARMVNLDYIPTGFTLLDMMAAFQEEAEIEYENAKLDRLPEVKLVTLKLRVEACMARHKLAKCLLDHLNQELVNPDDSLLVRSSDTSSIPRLELESVADWASDKYGIGIPDWSDHDVSNGHGNDSKNERHTVVAWKDVTIKIYKDYKLGCVIGKQQRKQSHFRDIDLMGKRKNDPNLLGGILIGLSQGKKFPPNSKKPLNKHAAALSKLRATLKKLTGITSDPFYPIKDHDGWKPIFKLIDDQNNAEERAKQKAQHVSYDDTQHYDIDNDTETRDFDDENDEAESWLKKKEPDDYQ